MVYNFLLSGNLSSVTSFSNWDLRYRLVNLNFMVFKIFILIHLRLNAKENYINSQNIFLTSVISYY